MAEKKTKKPAKMANRNVGAEVIKDDGQKYSVVSPNGRAIYGGTGVALAEAVRLATTLVAPAGVAQVEPDGTLLAGTVNDAGEFVAAA